MSVITCFTIGENPATLGALKSSPLVGEVHGGKEFRTSASVKWIASLSDTEYTLVFNKASELGLIHYALDRMVQIARDTQAVMLYSDHFKIVDGKTEEAPVIDLQKGSLRDDFDFGSLLLFRTDALKKAAAEMDTDYQYAGMYDLRLRLSRIGKIEHINEYLYYDIEFDTRTTGEKLFDYVDPKNRAVQIEMEQACTAHLKAIGGYLKPEFKDVDLKGEEFEYEASVVIPCRNRVKTIGDAIRSAVNQETTFKYNVIVVDDNSTDGTVDVIKELLKETDRLIYIAQDPTYHAIGGNWNAALHHPKCGRFALQLDSDDVYNGPDTVQKFVEAFYAQDCAMVIGTYQITDFDMHPTGVAPIDHREWTPDNGRNNALRINGLGAPRGFYTPLVRDMTFPTTKYGEDYAVALRISRNYHIGRVYDVMYNCRRWSGNSDAALSREVANRYNTYKDRIRTWELLARIEQNSR